VLNGLPYVRIMRVSRSLECGSHAAAPAVLTVHGTPLPVLVTGKLDVLVSIIESVRHACDTCA
jgi:hypothetical protein